MTKTYKNNIWNPWTAKSIDTKFETTEQAVGDGEQKLGVEYGQKPQGQNVSYDLDILGEKWEVKKLDSDNSFRLGVEVSTSYRHIIDSVTRILEQIVNLEELLEDSKTANLIKVSIEKIKSTSGRTTTLLIDGLRKNEVSSANLDKANEIIELIKTLIITENKKVSLYSSYDGSIAEYDLLTAYNKLSFESISIEEKLIILDCDLDFYNRLLLTIHIGRDVSTFKLLSLKEKLNNLVRSIFTDIKLVLVQKDKGYKPVTDLNKIYCNRITSGNPRCKIRE
jgi:hypothetical protein